MLLGQQVSSKVHESEVLPSVGNSRGVTLDISHRGVVSFPSNDNHTEFILYADIFLRLSSSRNLEYQNVMYAYVFWTICTRSSP